MSAVLKLLRPGMYVKRWFVVLLVGMVVVSLGIGFALTEAYRSAVAPAWVGVVTLQFLPLLVRAALFLVLGGASGSVKALPRSGAWMVWVKKVLGLVMMGMGLWSAAAHRGKYAPLLLARTRTDGGDALAICLAVGAGYRAPRFLSLGALALGAAVTDAALYWVTRQAARDAE